MRRRLKIPNELAERLYNYMSRLFYRYKPSDFEWHNMEVKQTIMNEGLSILKEIEKLNGSESVWKCVRHRTVLDERRNDLNKESIRCAYGAHIGMRQTQKDYKLGQDDCDIREFREVKDEM